jgi:hypothetical protein
MDNCAASFCTDFSQSGAGAARAGAAGAETLGDPARPRECWTQALALFEAIEDPNAETVRRWLAELDG